MLIKIFFTHQRAKERKASTISGPPNYVSIFSSMYKVFSPTPDAIIGWFWRIVAAWRCSFHHICHNSVINYQCFTIIHILGWLLRIVSSPTVIPSETPIHFHISTNAPPPFRSKLRVCLPNHFTIIDYGCLPPPFYNYRSRECLYNPSTLLD